MGTSKPLTWHCFGDSLTDGAGQVSYVRGLMALERQDHFVNEEIGSQLTNQIIARLGAIPARLTLDQGAIPGKGTAMVKVIKPALMSTPADRRVRSLAGTLSGVAGTLQRN